MSGDLQSRTANALRQFDSNMSAIFDRAAFYDGDLFSTKNSSPSLSRSQGCFKWTLLAANVVFLIFAVVLLSVGAYTLNNPVGALSGVTLPAGLIVLGVFILLVSILGGASAWFESRGVLGVYFALLLLFTILLLGVGSAVYAKRNDVDSYIHSGWQGAGVDLRNSLQIAFSCCGLDSYNDTYAVWPCPGVSWTSTGWFKNVDYPACAPTLDSAFSSDLTTAGGCGIAFAVVMIVGMCFVCFLMDGIKRKRMEQDLATLRATNEAAEQQQAEVSVETADATY